MDNASKSPPLSSTPSSSDVIEAVDGSYETGRVSSTETGSSKPSVSPVRAGPNPAGYQPAGFGVSRALEALRKLQARLGVRIANAGRGKRRGALLEQYRALDALIARREEQAAEAGEIVTAFR